MDLSWPIGEKFVEVREIAPGGFAFTFDNFHFSLSCVWRVEKENKILIANGDHEQQYGRKTVIDISEEVKRILKNEVIAGGLINTISGDFTINFKSGIIFRAFNDSSGYEAWDMQGPDGHRLISISGGKVITI